MQRLEVRGAVRPIYASLGVKRLNQQLINPLKHEIQLRYSLFNLYPANVENRASS